MVTSAQTLWVIVKGKLKPMSEVKSECSLGSLKISKVTRVEWINMLARILIQWNLQNLLKEIKKISLVTHDESSFESHDGKRCRWKEEENQALYPKGSGRSIMVSKFYTSAMARWRKLLRRRLLSNIHCYLEPKVISSKPLEWSSLEKCRWILDEQRFGGSVEYDSNDIWNSAPKLHCSFCFWQLSESSSNDTRCFNCQTSQSFRRRDKFLHIRRVVWKGRNNY